VAMINQLTNISMITVVFFFPPIYLLYVGDRVHELGQSISSHS